MSEENTETQNDNKDKRVKIQVCQLLLLNILGFTLLANSY